MSWTEKERIILQRELDQQKSALARNILGQFSTPTALAQEILQFAKNLMQGEKSIRFLDPAIGTGSFYSALLKTFPHSSITQAVGYEIDPHYGIPAQKFWQNTPININIDDFTIQRGDANFNLIICNPPYVRHHHISPSEKTRLQKESLASSGIKISALSGLYSYFMTLCHTWLAPHSISAWLVPSEFMDVNYGSALKDYLLNKVTTLQIHRFDPKNVQFSDALVSSAIVWFRNELPSKKHRINFTFGGSLLEPSVSKLISIDELVAERKWTRFPVLETRKRSDHKTISDFFEIRRGIATGNNKFFILDKKEIARRNLPLKYFKPILCSPRYMKQNEIQRDHSGNPIIEKKLFLLDINLPEPEIKTLSKELWDYLQEGKASLIDKGYLCSHRKPWYSQEKRPPPPIVCTYLGRTDGERSSPFRFIANHSEATITNVYLALYPKSSLIDLLANKGDALNWICEYLNAICPTQLIEEGRVYGGGLHKLEPKELGNVPVPKIQEAITQFIEKNQ